MTFVCRSREAARRETGKVACDFSEATEDGRRENRPPTSINSRKWKWERGGGAAERAGLHLVGDAPVGALRIPPRLVRDEGTLLLAVEMAPVQVESLRFRRGHFGGPGEHLGLRLDAEVTARAVAVAPVATASRTSGQNGSAGCNSGGGVSCNGCTI